jgi:hypothetical protein
MAGGDVLAFLSDARFWETVLSAMVPHRHPLRAVSTQEVRPMATMYQPQQSAYQTPLGGYQPGMGTAQQPSAEDIQRIAPVLGPVLANVLPAVLTPIISNIYAQQRINPAAGFGGAFQPTFGAAGMQTSPEDMQRILPVLGPILANVLPAVVPQIVHNIVTQQRGGLPWGGQQFGGQQFGLGPQGTFGQPGMFGSPDLTQSITQSVHDALRRMGGQSPAMGGRF